MRPDHHALAEQVTLALDPEAGAAVCAVDSAERSLMRAVLEQAFVDVGLGVLVGKAGARSGGGQVPIEARRWFRDPGRHHLFSFMTICDTLGIDARTIRLRVHAGDGSAVTYPRTRPAASGGMR